MTETGKTQLRRKRKDRGGIRGKFRLCLLFALLFLTSGIALYHKDTFPPADHILHWLKQTRPAEVAAPVPSLIRGNIYDRNFRPLAATYKTYAIWARPLEMTDADHTAAVLAQMLGLKKSRLLQNLKGERGFIWISKGVDQKTADSVRRKNIKGVYQIAETNRYYPNADMAAHAVGFVENGQGLDGIEFQYNAVLRGDETGDAELDSLNFRPNIRQKGSRTHLVLSLDLMLQAKIEDFLRKRMAITGASSGTAILMNANTGELYALASTPIFNPNRYWEFSSNALKNHALTDPVYPGELGLIVQQAAAFKLQRETEEAATLDAADEPQPITVIEPEVMKRRRNSFAPHVDPVDPAYLAEFTGLLGFDKTLATDLSLRDETPASLAVAITDPAFNSSALRLLNGFTALVNGGRLVTPHLLYRAYQNDSPAPLEITHAEPEDNPVIDTDTSRELKEFLAAKWLGLSKASLASDTPMFFEGHHFITRPANTPDDASADAEPGHNIMIPYLTQNVMLGAIPGRNPEMTLIAVLSYQTDSDDVSPDMPDAFGRTLSVLRPDQDMVDKMLHVVAVEPPNPSPGFWDKETTMLANIVDPDLIDDPGQPSSPDIQDRTMPDVTGKSLRAGLQILQHFNLDIKVVGSGRIVSQKPPAGTILVNNAGECILQMQREI